MKLFLTLMQHDSRGSGEGDGEVPIGFAAPCPRLASGLRRRFTSTRTRSSGTGCVTPGAIATTVRRALVAEVAVAARCTLIRS